MKKIGIREDLTGRRFSRLLVISLNEEKTKARHGRGMWNCQCDCGKQTVVAIDQLKSGRTKSCGCYCAARLNTHNRKQNRYVEHESYIEVFDTSGQSFLIDYEDYDYCRQYYYSISVSGYAIRTENKKTIRLSRELTKAPNNKVVDHINHNTLDNRRANLRVITQKENCYNTRRIKNKSGVKGVYLSKGKFKVEINSQRVGTFDTLEKAAAVRKENEKILQGECRYKPEEDYRNF